MVHLQQLQYSYLSPDNIFWQRCRHRGLTFRPRSSFLPSAAICFSTRVPEFSTSFSTGQFWYFSPRYSCAHRQIQVPHAGTRGTAAAKFSYWLCKVWVWSSLSSPAKFSTHFCPAAAAPSEAGTKLQLPTTLDDPINKSPKYTQILLCTYNTLTVPM